jgi:hypothetical protein
MDREEVLGTLKAREHDLRKLGVRHIALFARSRGVTRVMPATSISFWTLARTLRLAFLNMSA